jgi:hypothetical protein
MTLVTGIRPCRKCPRFQSFDFVGLYFNFQILILGPGRVMLVIWRKGT